MTTIATCHSECTFYRCQLLNLWAACHQKQLWSFNICSVWFSNSIFFPTHQFFHQSKHCPSAMALRWSPVERLRRLDVWDTVELVWRPPGPLLTGTFTEDGLWLSGASGNPQLCEWQWKAKGHPEDSHKIQEKESCFLWKLLETGWKLLKTCPS